MIGKNNKEVKLSFKDILKHNFIFFYYYFFMKKNYKKNYYKK